MSELLDRLCLRCGLLPGYTDIWGEEHRPSDAARRAVLRAQGIEAETDEQIAAALHRLDSRDWTRPLRPVQVDREGQAHRIGVSLPAGEGDPLYRWRLRRESGAEDQGEFVPVSLEEAGRAQLDGQLYLRRMVALDLAVEPGYHRFSIERADRADGAGPLAEMSFIVAPAACYAPPALQGAGRAWGVSAQLYGIRSEHNWGIGDFGDLGRLLDFCGEAGAAAVMLNPLHELFPGVPEHIFPYSPSSRCHFNALYLDVEAVPDLAECPEMKAMVDAPAFQARLRTLRAEPRVDYPGVAEVKSAVLEGLYRSFRERHLAFDSDRARAFHAFRAERGEGLRWQAIFDALLEDFRRQDPGVWGWPAWPEAYRDPRAPEVQAFLAAHLERVEYFEYLQWLAWEQLAQAGARSLEHRLGVGLVFDLAVGVAGGGAATWARQELHALGASAGAPPDEINRMGQDWGLPPWIPDQLTEACYEPFKELLRSQMALAGGLRLDHVMGLFRLFWVAPGLPIAEGVYVAYPFADLLGILALESQRNHCLVIGEDLGTVPDEVRRSLQPMGVMSTRLLYFERRGDGRLKPPYAYPANACAAVTTHDLPTLAGFWQGLDIDLRTDLRLFPNDEVRNQQIVGRAEDRVQLLLALEREGLVPSGSGLHPVDFPEMTAELAAAVYTYLARAPSKLLLVQMEDGFGGREQPNLPGTLQSTYPSWRLKLPANLEEWRASPYLEGILLALRRERPVLQGAGGEAPAGLRSWIPRATYRLQVNKDFPLRQVTALVPYLDELGISHCYLSPLLTARPGSLHGYDITDHGSLNPEIAGMEDLEQFAGALKEHGMGLILDMVPNHMGIMGADNRWWLDVLENGPASRYAAYFDIDWHPLSEDLRGRVLLPVLGDAYGTVLENGGLRLVFAPDAGSFSVLYGEHRFPVDPGEYPRILARGAARLQARLGPGDAGFLEFQSLVTAFGHLPGRSEVSPEAVAERSRDKEVHKRHLAALCGASPDLAQFIEANLAELNGADLEGLHELLEAQAYRLAHWRVAADEINYRRFFDINTLAALRMDNPEVFESTHRLVRDLLGRGWVNGMRIDHPDGLFDPKGYFERLQSMARALGPSAEGGAKPLYLVAEKVLCVNEQLPASWPIHGTTGYDFAAACDGLFVDPAGEERFSHLYNAFTRSAWDLENRIRKNKYLILKTLLAGEWQVLATQLTRLAKWDRRTSDYTFNGLRSALAEILVSFPVYRTYVAAGEASPEDVRTVDRAVGLAKQRSQAAETSIYDFVRDVLLARHGQGRGGAYQDEVAAFAMKFQQYSGPVMAKGMEDTTFYQYNRLVSLNEVGSSPSLFGVSPDAFHAGNQDRARCWPHAMLAGSTHDSKRSADVRARISALSEIPGEWQRAVSRWRKLTHGHHSGPGPSRNDEYLLYQTLIGIWPFDPPGPEDLDGLLQRTEAFMLKAGREAKEHSSWINPDDAYEEATRGFLRALLAPSDAFMQDFLWLHGRVARAGACTSLSQQLLRLTAPGVPDFYQGSELWDFSLVDPDNRRPVDYAARRAALDAIKAMHEGLGAAACARTLLGRMQDGWIKLYLIWKTLDCRRRREALFREGDYLALEVRGQRARHACAFARRFRGERVVVVVPRLLCGLMGETAGPPLGEPAWGDTWVELPPAFADDPWTHVLTDEGVSLEEREGAMGFALAELFRILPCGLVLAR